MTFPNSAHDADAQLAAARRAAHAWLRSTLATLPAAVTSLSVGAVLDEGGDRPDMVPRLKAEVFSESRLYPQDVSEGERGTPPGSAMQALYDLYDLDDDLRTHTAPFLFAIGSEEWLTVTRADLAASVVPAAFESVIHAAIIQAIVDIPRCENMALRFYRSAEGVLTWSGVAP